jgi:N-dimethylarginine dimethylaminohydrolase
MKLSQNEFGNIKSILLKDPQQAFRNRNQIEMQWKDLNYTDMPDMEEAIAEYQSFAQIISESHSDIIYLNENETTGLDSIYVRDASIATREGMIICNMGKDARSGEPEAQRQTYEKHGIKVLGQIMGPGKVEGGDVAWLNSDTLAIGRGYRTNEEGIRQVCELLSGFADVVRVHLPHYRGESDVFHLMSIISPVDKDLAVVYSPLMSVPFRDLLLDMGYQFVEVPDEEFESMGCNVFALGPRMCVMVHGNPVTKKRLEDVGAEVIEYKGEEISLKGCGGPTCLTRPLIREI